MCVRVGGGAGGHTCVRASMRVEQDAVERSMRLKTWQSNDTDEPRLGDKNTVAAFQLPMCVHAPSS